jgi:hypothetical protein
MQLPPTLEGLVDDTKQNKEQSAPKNPACEQITDLVAAGALKAASSVHSASATVQARPLYQSHTPRGTTFCIRHFFRRSGGAYASLHLQSQLRGLEIQLVSPVGMNSIRSGNVGMAETPLPSINRPAQPNIPTGCRRRPALLSTLPDNWSSLLRQLHVLAVLIRSCRVVRHLSAHNSVRNHSSRQSSTASRPVASSATTGRPSTKIV